MYQIQRIEWQTQRHTFFVTENSISPSFRQRRHHYFLPAEHFNTIEESKSCKATIDALSFDRKLAKWNGKTNVRRGSCAHMCTISIIKWIRLSIARRKSLSYRRISHLGAKNTRTQNEIPKLRFHSRYVDALSVPRKRTPITTQQKSITLFISTSSSSK